jgi:hypothetical protein
MGQMMQIIKQKKQLIIVLAAGLIILIFGIVLGYILTTPFRVNELRDPQVAPEQRGDLPLIPGIPGIDEALIDPVFSVTGVVKSIENQKIVLELLQGDFHPDFVPNILTILPDKQARIFRTERIAVAEIAVGKTIIASSGEDMKETVKNQGEFVADFIGVGRIDDFLPAGDQLVPGEERLDMVFGVVKSIENQKIVIEVQKNILPDFVPNILTIRPDRQIHIIRTEQTTIAKIAVGETIVAGSEEDMKEVVRDRGEFVADLISIGDFGF